MKIDAYRETQTVDGAADARPARTRAAPTTGGVSGDTVTERRSPAGTGVTDQVTLSADAQLLADALKAADSAPHIRVDVVERMRAKLAAGDVGADPVRLADRMIDELLEP
jgi:flagellar biosynthesis anti-sigma factor FlgM